MEKYDLSEGKLRTLNERLQSATKSDTQWWVENPEGGHAIAVGLDAPLQVTVNGSTGYYCAGMNKLATVRIKGSVGPGVAENMMSGKVIVEGNASQYAGATGNGGRLVIKGNASSRCGISMKGIEILVQGSVGHMSGFMAQSGKLVILEDAGDSLGDSLYEAQIFVRGQVKNLGVDCIEKEMQIEHFKYLEDLFRAEDIDCDPREFKRYGSERKLYHFNVDNISSY